MNYLAEAQKDLQELKEAIANPADMESDKVLSRMQDIVNKDNDLYSQLDDFTLGGTVRMLMRNSLMHEGLVCAARNRIYRLSLALRNANRELAEVKAELATLKGNSNV